MTTDDHLDDEALSLVLDGEGADAERSAHLDGCATCTGRLAVLASARDAVAAAVVAPLAPAVLDDLVERALAAGDEAGADVVPLARARARAGARRVRRPPGAWMGAAAAAIVVLLGVTFVARMVADDPGTMAQMKLPTAENAGRAGAETDDAAAVADGSATAGGGTAMSSAGAGTAVSAAAPDVVSGDLGDQADPQALVAAFEARVPAPAPSVASPAPTTVPPSDRTGGAATEATAEAPAADRARCRDQAERAGAGRLGSLLATVTVRWQGQPAEVLVYALASPTPKLSRQALVLSRPACSVLADVSF